MVSKLKCLHLFIIALGLFAGGLFSSSVALAYIPDYRMILSRVAENNGRGAYLIEQDLALESEGESFLFKEVWVIQSEHRMSVELKGTSATDARFGGHIIYDANYRYFQNTQGNLTKAPLTQDWWMPFFHFRFSKNIKQKLSQIGIFPQQLRDDIAADQEISSAVDVRLARIAGGVAYAFGPPTPAGVTPALPGLWVEQDQFVIRKLRLPSEAEVRADQYQSYPRFQHQPKQIQVRWDSHMVRINSTKVVPLAANHELLKKLSVNSFKGSKKATLNMPNNEALRDFYTRFR